MLQVFLELLTVGHLDRLVSDGHLISCFIMRRGLGQDAPIVSAGVINFDLWVMGFKMRRRSSNTSLLLIDLILKS